VEGSCADLALVWRGCGKRREITVHNIRTENRTRDLTWTQQTYCTFSIRTRRRCLF